MIGKLIESKDSISHGNGTQILKSYKEPKIQYLTILISEFPNFVSPPLAPIPINKSSSFPSKQIQVT